MAIRAPTVVPLQAGSAAVTEMPDPEPGAGELLVEGIALGVCGTDREIMDDVYGWAPPGEERLILGHESLGRVLEAPPDNGFAAGDLVVGVVRRPDPETCPACERRDDRRAARRQRGLEVHVLDRSTEGPKPELVGRLGAHYHSSDVETVAGEAPPDVIVEATGAPQVGLDAIAHNAAAGVVCLTGVSPRGRELTVDTGGLNRDLVLENDVVFRLGQRQPAALRAGGRGAGPRRRVVARGDDLPPVPLEEFATAVEKQRSDVKVVLEL